MKMLPDLEFTLHAAPPVGAVGVRLRRFGERWVASSDVRGGRTGLGTSPRDALTAAIEPLGARAMQEMLADVSLLQPSLVLVKAENETGAGA